MACRPTLLRLPALALPALLVGACASDAPPFGSQLPSEPVLFAQGVISTAGSDEFGITFSPDAREAYFARSSGGRRGRPRIFVSRFENGTWAEAVPASFSLGWEESPFITRDGQRLLYSSRRDVPGWGPVPGNLNLWVVERTEEVWSNPVPLPGEVNRPRVDGRGMPTRDETGALLLPDGTLLYSSESEPERGSDIYAADPVDGRYVNVRPMLLNTAGDEASPAVSPDGRFLVFHGRRDPLAPGDDLFVSERTEYGWSEPQPLPEPVNSLADERDPRFSPDGRLLFFSSNRGSGRLSIYHVSAASAGVFVPPP